MRDTTLRAAATIMLSLICSVTVGACGGDRNPVSDSSEPVGKESHAVAEYSTPDLDWSSQPDPDTVDPEDLASDLPFKVADIGPYEDCFRLPDAPGIDGGIDSDRAEAWYGTANTDMAALVAAKFVAGYGSSWNCSGATTQVLVLEFRDTDSARNFTLMLQEDMRARAEADAGTETTEIATLDDALGIVYSRGISGGETVWKMEGLVLQVTTIGGIDAPTAQKRAVDSLASRARYEL